MKNNKKKTNHSSSFGRLWSYLQAYRFPLYLAIFLKIVSVIMSVLEPVVIGLAITELTKNTLAIIKGVEGAHINVSYVGLVLVVYLLRGLIYELAAYYSNYFMTNAVQATVQDMRNEMTEKINRTSVSYFDKHQFGDLLGRFTSDVETVSNALQQSFLQVVNAVFTLALVIGTVLYLNLQLGAIVVITIPITFFGARYIMSKSQPYFKQQADALGTLNGFVQENLTGFNVLKLFGREDRSLDDFKEITEDLQKVGFKANFISGLMMPVLNGLSDLTYLIVAVLGGLQVLAGRLTIGNMQAFVQYVWQINQPIQNLTQLAGQLQSAKSSLDRIFQLMDEPDEANDATEVLDGDLTGQVSFKHVDFQYVADKPLIRDFNLEVNPGEMVDESLMGTTFGMDKRRRVESFASGSSHAMTLVAVDLDADGRPKKWMVENSWGPSSGYKGHLIMTDRWFDEYMFRLVVERKYVPQRVLDVLKQKPVRLPAWDPMFADEE